MRSKNATTRSFAIVTLLAAMLCAATLTSCAQKPPQPQDQSQAIGNQIRSALGDSVRNVAVRQATFSTTDFYDLPFAIPTADWGYKCRYELRDPALDVSFELMESDRHDPKDLPLTPDGVDLSRDDFTAVLEAFASGTGARTLRRFKRYCDDWGPFEDATITIGSRPVPARECYVLYSDAPELSASQSDSPGWMQYASVVHLSPKTHKARWLCPLERATGSMTFPPD